MTHPILTAAHRLRGAHRALRELIAACDVVTKAKERT
jgi:hypothetical protein